MIFKQSDVSVWLPSQPLVKSRATLFTREDGAFVLDGISGPLANDLALAERTPLNGYTENGREITCVDWFRTKERSNRIGKALTCEVRQIFSGIHFSETQPIFDSANVYYTRLHDWINLSLFETARDDRGTVVSAPNDLLWDATVADGWRFLNCTNASSHTSHSPTSEVSFKYEAGVHLRAPTASTWNEFAEREKQFRFLINVLGDCELEISKINLARGLTHVELYDSTLRGQSGPQPFLEAHQPLAFVHVRERFNELFRRWGDVYPKLRSIVPLFLWSKHNDSLTEESAFLATMQSVEGLHRAKGGGKFMPDAEYEQFAEAIVQAIPAGIDPDLRQKLKSSIKYANDFSLRRRLRELLAGLPEHFSFERLKEDSAATVGVTADTRNYLTHQDTESGENTASGARLHQLTDIWHVVFLAHLLLVLGVEEMQVVKAVARMRARWLAEF